MHYVYVDELFFTNLVMNFLILWATAGLAHLFCSTRRLLAGAAIGALYSFIVFLPGVNLLISTIGKLLFACLLVLVVFAPLSVRKYLKTLACFYLVSFVIGGAAFGVIYLTDGELVFNNGAVYYSANSVWKGLFAAIAVGILVGRWLKAYLHQKQWQRLFLFPLVVYFGDVKIEVDALLDTGNLLKDPVSGYPVIILEEQVLLPALPPAVQAMLQCSLEGEWTAAAENFDDAGWFARLRVIPFRSLGKQNGLLMGLRPDRVEISDGAKKYEVRNVIIGVYRKPLCAEGTYHALLHPEIIQIAVN